MCCVKLTLVASSFSLSEHGGEVGGGTTGAGVGSAVGGGGGSVGCDTGVSGGGLMHLFLLVTLQLFENMFANKRALIFRKCFKLAHCPPIFN